THGGSGGARAATLTPAGSSGSGGSSRRRTAGAGAAVGRRFRAGCPPDGSLARWPGGRRCSGDGSGRGAPRPPRSRSPMDAGPVSGGGRVDAVTGGVLGGGCGGGSVPVADGDRSSARAHGGCGGPGPFNP